MATVPDFTDVLDQANTVTSNAASVLRGLIEAGEQGVELTLDRLRPIAEQLDALFGNADNPVPTAPDGGVPVDGPLAGTDRAAADAVGVTG